MIGLINGNAIRIPLRVDCLDWYGLHGEGWGDLLVPDAYAHPAKVKRALARRIYAHLLERGYIERGQTVVDPFAGIAGFALHAMQNGLHFIGVELEPRFFILGGEGMDCPGFDAAFYRRYNQRGKKWHKLGICPTCGHALDDYVPFKEFFGAVTRKIPRSEPHHYAGNIGEWNRRFDFPGTAVLLQGDSRRLCEVVGEAGVLVSSPPYASSVASDDPDKRGGLFRDPKRRDDKTLTAEYGNSDGQLAAMREGELDGIVGSPPYATCPVDVYGENPGGGLAGGNSQNTHHKDWKLGEGYGGNPGQLANLPAGDAVDAVCGSPPYEGSHVGAEDNPYINVPGGKLGTSKTGYLVGSSNYGSTDGQLGTETGETFWSAAHTIMRQCHAILKPGGVAVWVCKRFVRNKQIVEFSQQWAQLGEACGFETIEWIRAWLTEDRGAQYDLFGGLDERTVKRVSFFRRLYESKYPDNSIDWEDVIIQRKV